MRKEFFNKLCCPIDKSDLTLQVIKETPEGDVFEGLMRCTQCERYYPIVHSIPIMSPDEYRQLELEEPILKKWGMQLSEKNRADFKLLE